MTDVTDFETILAEVEARAAAERRRAMGRARARRALAGSVASTAARFADRSAAGAYAACSEPAAPFDVAWCERELDAACGDARALRALRRRLAWMLHPDRAPNPGYDALLARFNARIDAALAASKAASARP